MKQSIKTFLILFNVLQLHAQSITQQAPWQQKADYDITVKLNPSTNTLDAFIQIHYFNNSPDTLKSIWMHVWPNAYKNTTTAFALQLLQNGKTDFNFSNDKEKGYIEGFNFKQNEDTLLWNFDSTHIDILEVKLKQPLLPNSDILISSPFKVKLPKLFSRSGTKESFFAITQWYPKPAVYDVNGWNTMPYLDQGEFYSEFGNYNVSITLPEKYLVAATGNLETPSEIKLLDSISKSENKQYNNHSNRYKTIKYSEKNIHDFAWFADTIFKVHRSFVKLKNGDTIITWMFIGKEKRNQLYKSNPISNINKAIKAYSSKVGNYPYKQCTAVIGSIFAGGGMEYPTITVCESADANIIIHEVGHNWFYGILGNNERNYPWMDESINTFCETKISYKLNGDTSFFKDFKGKNWLENYETMTGYLFSARQGISQQLNMSSEEFSGLNYGSIVYCKGPLLFAYLENILGDSVFNLCLKNYFIEWQYRHPLPKDMQNSFEKTSGKNLDWFFIDLLNENNTIDVIQTKNQLVINGSQKLETMIKNENLKNVNPFGFLPETNYLNNGQKLKLLTVNMPLHLPRQNARIAMNLTPIVGYNFYDKIYAGFALFNRTIFRKKFEYILMPAYSFTSNKIVGYGKLNFMLFSKKKNIFKTETGIQGQSFGMQIYSQKNQYYRVNPYFRLYFKHKGNIDERFEHLLQLNLYQTGLEKTSYQYNDTIKVSFPHQYFFNYLKVTWQLEDKHPVHHYLLKLNTEFGSTYKTSGNPGSYLKTWLNAEYSYQYAKKKYIKTSLFGGIFLTQSGSTYNQRFFLSGNNGSTDYLYNEAMLGRSENIFSNNILGHQVLNNNGNMRNTISFIPSTDNWMLATSNEANLPGIIPFRIYLDLGYYPFFDITKFKTAPALIYTAGLTLPLFKETLEIFIPLFQSKQFLQYNLYNYTIPNSIGFKLNLNKWDPAKQIDNFRP